MERFVSSIKRKYKEKLVNRDKQWPPCHVNKLIRLKIVENNKSRGYFSWPWGRRGYRRLLDENLKKATISYDDLFKAENMVKPVRKVLVEGDAGIGKTTLCISVSEDWANGKLFQQFKLVLLLPLRMKAVSSASSLPELLQLLHPSRSICESVASYIEEEEGENVLIIADGWDELGKQVQEESFVYQLLFHLFPFMSVVVTSRPSACHSLHHLPNIDRFIEVCGFSNEHIIQYIHSEFSGDEVNIGHFLEQLENNPLLESVCSIPLNCAIVCHLWRVFEEALPMTMTELYTSIMLNVVLHNLRKTDSHRTISSLSSFDSLPVNLQQSWWLLCEFAFQMLKDDQLVFTQDEFTKFFPKGFALDEEILCFGLLQSAESIILETGYGISLHFLHLTFQEFLAAMHIARQPPEKLWNIIQSLQSAAYISGGRLQMMWRFLFGILFRGSNIEAQHNIISNIRKTLMYVSGTLKRPNNMLACHCSFEAQNVFINIEVTEFLAGRKSHGRASFGYPRTAHDCAAVLYVISNMWEGDSIVINFANSGVREYQILTLVNLLADRAKTFKVTEFYLSGNRLTLPSLQALQEAVFGDMLTNLKRLYLTRSLTDDADTNGAWLSVFIGSLLAHCPHLTHFDVSCNNLGVPGARAFADSLSKLYNHTSYDSSLDCALKEQELGQFLTNIDFTDTNLYNDGLVAFVKGLECSCNFDEVSLKANHISVTGASCLADAICLGIIAINGELNISDNPIKLEGTTVFGHILSNEHNKSAFKGVNLSKCELTTVANGSNPLNTDSSCFGSDSSVNEAIRDVGKQLLQMPQNTNITQLILDGNSFAGMGINILAGFIHLTPCLNNLNTCNCSISSDEVLQLLEKLLELKSSSPNLFNCLKHWKLDNNNISDSGISALVDCLSSLFTSCSKLSFRLDNNPVSSEMIKRLKEELKRCQQVCYI